MTITTPIGQINEASGSGGHFPDEYVRSARRALRRRTITFSVWPQATAAASAFTAAALHHGGPADLPDAYDRPVETGESRSLAGGAVLRQARPGDEDGILECVRGLAEYENEPDAVQTTAEDLRRVLFGATPSVFAHVVEKDGQIAAIAVWFLNFSTFTGRQGIYLEDLFVREGERRHGYGRALVKALAEVCVQRGYRRFEWSVLDWNEPSIRFYRSIGAVGMDEWKTQRLSGDALMRLATSD